MMNDKHTASAETTPVETVRLYKGAVEAGKVNLLLLAARCIAQGSVDEGMGLVCAMVDRHRAQREHQLLDLLLGQQQLALETLQILDDHGERIVAAYAGSVS